MSVFGGILLFAAGIATGSGLVIANRVNVQRETAQLRRENEQVVEGLLKENKEYSLEKLPLPAIFPENTTGMLTLVPGEYDTDGFFIAKLRRNV